jgi:hypothetical protein
MEKEHTGMKLISVGLDQKVIKRKEGHFPTVGDLLDYIAKNDIPRTAEIVVEHVEDIYLYKYYWSQYKIPASGYEDEKTMLPVHNGFGSMEEKKYFVLWMHY